MTETRAEKAQRLVNEGCVRIWERTEYVIRAYVKDNSWHLTILYPQHHYFCECSIGKAHLDSTDLCAHALAVKLAVERRNESC